MARYARKLEVRVSSAPLTRSMRRSERLGRPHSAQIRVLGLQPAAAHLSAGKHPVQPAHHNGEADRIGEQKVLIGVPVDDISGSLPIACSHSNHRRAAFF